MAEVDYPVMPEPEWAKPRDKKMQSTVWPVSFSLEFVPLSCLLMKKLCLALLRVLPFFLNLSQRLKCDKIFALLLPTGLFIESLKMVAFLLNRQLILLWGFQLPTIFDDPNIPHSYPKNRNQSHMPECCLSKLKHSLLKQTGNHGNQWTSYKGKCWIDP